MNALERWWHQEVDISGILLELERIRETSDVVNCVFQATGSSWLGVNIAGRSMFPEATIELPQHYSNQVLSDVQIAEIYRKIVELDFRTFIFHGYLPYLSLFIEGLKSLDPSIRVMLVFHGFASELADNRGLILSVSSLVSMVKEKKIDKLGLVKVGHETLFKKLFGIPAVLLYNKVPVCEDCPRRVAGQGVHIGVLVNDSFRKNLHVQVLSALMCEGAMVHVLSDSELIYLPDRSRVVEHGMMPHLEFMSLLGAMDINLHITYSESFGGQVFTESLGRGVPCLTAFSNGYLDFDPELKSMLSVSEADDPVAIHARIEKVLPMRDQLQKRLIDYCKTMNNKADECLQQFIQG